jgi:polynucleotide 5'-kinase involved in rRNA processing
MCAKAMPDLIVKEDRKARKSWITRGIINKMDERRKRKNVNKEEGRKNYKQMRNELKGP